MAKLWSLRGLSWLELTKRTCRKSWDDEIFGQSARMALYFFFALFPVLLLLLILLGGTVGGASDWRDALLDSFKQVLPPDASALMMQTIQQISVGSVLGAGAILAAVYAAWGTLNGMWAVMTGLNKAYEVEEMRPWWRILLIMFSLTISLSLLGLVALTAIVYGNRGGKLLGRHLGAAAHFVFLWRSVQWTIIAILFLFSFASLYRFGPNLKDRRWQWSMPGAVIAVTLWFLLHCCFGCTRSTSVLQGSMED